MVENMQMARRVSARFPSRSTVAHSPQRAAMMKFVLFVFFVTTRAVHPMLIDLSKHDGKILYAKNTPVVVNKLLQVVLMNAVCFSGMGWKGVKQCWQPRCLMVFGLIGTVYALGDFLEMQSMSKLNGGVYQVLLQTKLLITALMLWWLKGSKQTSMQWHVLFAMFLATSAFVLVDQSNSSTSGAAPGSLPRLAVCCVMLKVAVSCYCAVLSEKYLKAFSDMPLPAKISGLSTTWAMASLVMSSMEPSVQQNGFFAHWDVMTCIVAVSFVVKTLTTMYLLQALDSLQKNIGEALAVIVIYVLQVSHPGLGKSFDLSVFLLAVLVVALVKTYLISPKVAANEKSALARSTQPGLTKLVALDTDGSAKMQTLGLNTMTCQVADSLPAGVFYGMLGGVHPVCGSTDPRSSTSCELMLLSHPPADSSSPDGHPSNKVSPDLSHLMSSASLTVLGHVRDSLPGKDVDVTQCMEDLDMARANFASHCLFGSAREEP